MFYCQADLPSVIRWCVLHSTPDLTMEIKSLIFAQTPLELAHYLVWGRHPRNHSFFWEFLCQQEVAHRESTPPCTYILKRYKNTVARRFFSTSIAVVPPFSLKWGSRPIPHPDHDSWKIHQVINTESGKIAINSPLKCSAQGSAISAQFCMEYKLDETGSGIIKPEVGTVVQKLKVPKGINEVSPL